MLMAVFFRILVRKMPLEGVRYELAAGFQLIAPGVGIFSSPPRCAMMGAAPRAAFAAEIPMSQKRVFASQSTFRSSHNKFAPNIRCATTVMLTERGSLCRYDAEPPGPKVTP